MAELLPGLDLGHRRTAEMKSNELKNILRLHGLWLASLSEGAPANLSGANLYGASLSGANLSGANLYGADLSRADLSGADLYGANLSRANLSRADLSGANLSGANLSGANLSRASLSGADLSGANLSGANLSGANLSRASLSGADLSGASLSGARGVCNAGEDGRGYLFLGCGGPGGLRVKAGCRYFTLDQARAHWFEKGNLDALARVEVIALWKGV